MLVKRQASHSPPPADLSHSEGRREPLSAAERIAVEVVVAAAIGFCVYGFASGAASTIGYVLSVIVIGAVTLRLRRTPVPGPVALGFALAAILDLAGGLINVGRDVLYNASVGPYSGALGTHYLQYDHFVHAYVSFVLTFVCWSILAAPYLATHRSRDLVILTVGLALGLGALNEVVEFAATLAHHGAHVGGYFNTGWDLICNLIGAGAGGLAIARSARAAHPRARGPAG
jgi:Predicted membrane protein (DUF2238)